MARMRLPRFTTLQLLLAAALCALLLGLATATWRASCYTQITALCYSPSGTYLAARYATGTIRVWKTESGRPRLTAEIPLSNNRACDVGQAPCFVDDTTLLDLQCQRVSPPATFEAAVRTIDVPSGAAHSEFSITGNLVGGYAAAGDTLAVVNRSSANIDCYSLRERRLLRQINITRTPAYGLSLTPDGRQLVIPDQQGSIHVCDLTSGQTICSVAANGVGTAAISRDGRRLAHIGWPASTLGSHVRLFDLASAAAALTMGMDHLRPTWVGFSADGSQLAVAGYDAAEIYNLDHDQIIGRIVLGDISRPGWNDMRGRWRSGGGFSPFALSPDGHTLASFDGGDVLLWDTRSGKLRTRVASHSRWPQILIIAGGFVAWGIAWGVVAHRQRPHVALYPRPVELKLIWGLMFIGGLVAVAVPVALLVTQGPLLWPGVYYALAIGLILIVGAAGRRTKKLERLPILQMTNLLTCDWVNFVLGVICHGLLRRPHVRGYLNHVNDAVTAPAAIAPPT